MSSNAFSKEVEVAFGDEGAAFDASLIMAQNATTFRRSPQEMARKNDTFWRPMPYIAISYDGFDQTNNFADYTQLSVPISVNIIKSVPFSMSPGDERDKEQARSIIKSGMQKLAVDLNVRCLDVASNFGSLVVKRSGAASGFDDVAACDAVFNEQGIPYDGRCVAYSTRDYNNMASNLQGLSRSFGNSTSDRALREAYIGNISGFETFKLDYSRRLLAASGGAGITISTLATGGNVYVPRATAVATTGEQSNVDNRFQTVTVSSTTNVRAGDAFTIATVTSLQRITKTDSGQLKTFRVVSVPSSTTMVITPPLITGQGGSEAEVAYQNCIVGTPASNSAITFLNTAATNINPFWHKDALVLMPATHGVETGNGASVMRMATKTGVEVSLTKFVDGRNMNTFYRLDLLAGVTLANTEMAGIELFSQP